MAYDFNQNLNGSVGAEHKGGIEVKQPANQKFRSDVSGDVSSTVTLATADQLDSKLTLNTEDPLESDLTVRTPEGKAFESSVKLDIAPVLSDVCARVTFGPVPKTRIHQPYCHRIGFSLFGLELASVEMRGHLESIVEPAAETKWIRDGQPARPTEEHGPVRVRLG